MKLLRLAHLASRIGASNFNELKLPYRLTYTVTNRCQARCVMCKIWQKPVQAELTLDEINLLFKQASFFSWINLTGGELFQRPDIQDVMRIIINNSPKLYLLNFPTNGFQTDDIIATVDLLLQTPLPRLIVSVSMDGNQQLHDDIRGLDDCWRRALLTFKELRKRRSKRFSVYLGHTLQSGTIGMFDETVNACNQAIKGVTINDFHINLMHMSGHYYGNADTDKLPDAEQAAEQIEYYYQRQTRNQFNPIAFIEGRYQKHIRHYLQHGRASFTCQAAAASCFINPSGIVYPCSVFDKPIGALRDYSMDLKILWSSKTRADIRCGIRSNACPGCWTPCEAYQTILANVLHRKRNK